jgi:hypothetical protein
MIDTVALDPQAESLSWVWDISTFIRQPNFIFGGTSDRCFCIMLHELVDERSKRIVAENSHPEISLSDTGEKDTAYTKSGNYIDINISVRTIHGVVHHALPFMTRICLLENNKYSATHDFENKVQILYHK